MKPLESWDIWNKYEKSLDYQKKKGTQTNTEKNWNFYIGNQWEGISLGNNLNKEDLPKMNIIKPTVKYKVSTITQKRMTARYIDMGSDLEQEKSDEACAILGEYFSKAWERSKMDLYMSNALKACAIQGDSYIFWNDDDPCKEPMILPNTEIFLSNENTTDIQSQNYVIIRERLTPEEVQKRAKANGIPKKDYENISTDSDTTEQLLNKDEVSDKVTSLIYMTKDDRGIVNISRSTKGLVYEELHAIEQEKNGKSSGVGATLYPIVSMVWEETPNSARGTSEVEQLIPNQLVLNKTLARRATAIKLSSFPRLAYDLSSIDNPEDIDSVGAAIGINGGDARSINQMVSYLQPAPITSDPKIFGDELMNNTRELAGAGDIATGNIDPSRASGAAITAVREQSQQPLNEQQIMVEQTVEDIALVWFDMVMAYNTKTVDLGYIIPVEDLRKIKPNIRIDVTDESAWSKYVEQQKLDNLLQGQFITFDEYLKVMPEDANFPKNKILNIIQERGVMNGNEEISGNEIENLESQIEQGRIAETIGTQESNVPDGGYMA